MKPTVFTPEVLQPYDPRHQRLVPPDTSVDEPPLVRVCINSKWISHVDGMLERLLYRDAWQGTDTEIDNAIQQVMLLMKMLGAAASEGCEVDLLFDIRATGCVLEKSEDGGQTWQTIIDLSDCVGISDVTVETLPAGSEATAEIVDGVLHLGIPRGDTGAQGAQGIQGEKGDKGDPGEPCDGCQTSAAPQTSPTNPTGRDVACAVADGVSQWLFDKFNDVLDVIDAGVTAALTGLRILNQVADVFLQFTIVGDEAANAIREFVSGSISITVAVIRSYDTVDFRERVSCYLFCRLVDTDGDFGNDFTSVLDPFIDDINAGEAPAIASPFTTFLRSIDISAYRNRAVIVANNEGECDACTDCPDTWCHVFDFTVSDQGWVPNLAPQLRAVYVSGVGWKHSTERLDRITAFIDPPGGNFTWTSATIEISSCTGVSNIGLGWFDVDYVACSGGVASDNDGESNVPAFGFDVVTNGAVDPAVTKVTLRGTGINPFGTDNCS